jgi:hypothetical protein
MLVQGKKAKSGSLLSFENGTFDIHCTPRPIYQGALREIGAKRPSGPSLKLLNVIDTKGVDVQSWREYSGRLGAHPKMSHFGHGWISSGQVCLLRRVIKTALAATNVRRGRISPSAIVVSLANAPTEASSSRYISAQWISIRLAPW